VSGVSKERIGSAGHVAGVDLCPETFAIARAAALEIDWREGDVSHLPLRDGELGRRCRLPTGQACSGRRDAASVVKGGRSAVATSRSDDEIPLMRELRRVAERRLPRSVGQDRLRGRERARCGTLRRWLADTRQWGCETLRQSERFGRRKHGEDYIRLRDSVVVAPDHIRCLGPKDSCNARPVSEVSTLAPCSLRRRPTAAPISPDAITAIVEIISPSPLAPFQSGPPELGDAAVLCPRRPEHTHGPRRSAWGRPREIVTLAKLTLPESGNCRS
jgi:hypothetical protein